MNAKPRSGVMFLAEECKREIQTADVLITLITLMLLGVNELKVKCFAASRHEVVSRGMQKRNASPHRGISEKIFNSTPKTYKSS